MKIINNNIKSYEDLEKLIKISEKKYSDYIKELTNSFVLNNHVKAISICGPTCSGKTTTANKIALEFKKYGKNACVLSIDDFYLDGVKERHDKGLIDFESIEAIDVDYFKNCTENLMNGNKTFIPEFDFKTGKRISEKSYIPHNNDIYIFEGIQVIDKKINEILKKYNTKSIFVGINNDVTFNGMCFSSEEIRLSRRIVRDYNFRAATVEETMKLWVSVIKNERNNINPNIKNADIFIDTFLDYELCIINYYLSPIIKECDYDRGSRINLLLNKLENIECHFYKEGMIPKNSMYHEFIG